MGLDGTDWVKIAGMNVGSFQVFIQNVTLTCVLQVKVYVFSKTSISSFFVQNMDFFVEDRYVRRRMVTGVQNSRFSKNHELIIDCCYFRARRQRRQPVNFLEQLGNLWEYYEDNQPRSLELC
jgi:hypothetical protein